MLPQRIKKKNRQAEVQPCNKNRTQQLTLERSKIQIEHKLKKKNTDNEQP